MPTRPAVPGARLQLHRRHASGVRRTYVLDTSVLLADPGAIRRFDEHEVVLPVVVITELEGKRHHPELGYFARSALRLLDELRVAARPARRSRCRSATRAARCGSSSTTPTRTSLPAGLPARRQRHPDPRRGAQPRRRGPRGHAGLQGPADAGQGVRGRAGRRGVPRRARSPTVRLDRHGRARGHRPPTSTSCTTTACVDLDGGPRPALPHRPGAAVRARQRARPGRAGQAGPAGARRPRGVRPARPLRRAAGRARPAARPRRRHRLARRPGRHRQVGARAVRRARGRAGAPPAPEGRRLPAAVRGRRPGARLPARQRVREDEPLGAGGLRHPRRADHRAT